jgi:quercetin dioxygenase-like cupin family protein
MLSPLAVLLALTAVFASAQSPSDKSVDVGEEPKHHLAFENEYVRAFEVSVPAGAETLIHRHSKPYIYVTIGNADIRNEVVGKDPATIHPKDGEVKFVQGGFAHTAVNVGKTDFHNVTIELLKTSDRKDVPPATVQGVSSAVLDHGWIADSYDLTAGASRRIPNSLRDYALIAVSDLDLTTSAERPSNPPVKMKAGEVKWFAGGVAQEWRNESTKPARYVVLHMIGGAQ